MAKKLKSGDSRKTRVVRTKEERIADFMAKAEALRLRVEVGADPAIKTFSTMRSNIRSFVRKMNEDPDHAFVKHEKVKEADIMTELERTLALLDDVAPIFGGHKVGAEEAA